MKLCQREILTGLTHFAEKKHPTMQRLNPNQTDRLTNQPQDESKQLDYNQNEKFRVSTNASDKYYHNPDKLISSLIF